MEFKEIIAAAKQAAGHQKISRSTDLIFTPAGDEVSAGIIDLEKYREVPSRHRGERTAYEVASFNRLLVDFTTIGSRVYVNKNMVRPEIIAVINDGTSTIPEWRDFRISLALLASPELLAWQKIDGKLLGQTDFAEFIEENANDIVDPAGAQMLEIASQLQATKSASFKSAVRLSDGQVQFHNIENLEAKVGAGHIDVPSIISLGLPVFVGSAPFKLKARFRYRIVEGVLTMGIKLERLVDVVNAVIDEIVEQIKTPDGVSIIFGSPGGSLK